MDLHHKILHKLHTLNSIINKLLNINVDDNIVELGLQITSCSDNYMLCILPFYITKNYDNNIASHFIEEINIIIEKLASIIKRIELSGKKMPNAQAQELQRNIDDIKKTLNQISDKIEIDNKVILPEVEECDVCKNKMQPISDTYELWCNNCGFIKYPCIVAKIENNTEVNKKGINNNYEPMKHYKDWINKIHGFEKNAIPNEVIDKIKYCIKRDKLVKRDITIKVIRKYLKDLHITNYNGDIVAISMRVDGPQPPKLSAEDNEKHAQYFQHIMNILEKLDETDHNRPYFPSFIYKIYEYMFRADHTKKEILKFIHVQSDDTVSKFNKLFSKICEYNNCELGIPYVRTTQFV